jgi:hypothetical protein
MAAAAAAASGSLFTFAGERDGGGNGDSGDEPHFELATFAADVTPPLGHPLLAGWREPAREIVDPLEARGFVLTGDGEPIVLVALDWCELRNDAYDRWRDALAAAASTKRERVLLSCVHQHDAPYADLTAQLLLEGHGAGSMYDRKFMRETIERVAETLRLSLDKRRMVTHFGMGEAKVDRVASNRRVDLEGSPPRFNRYSFTRDEAVRMAPEGTIDPMLKTLSFWDGDKPLAALSTYACHPMSYYGDGGVSCDFVGLARQRRQRDEPGIFQVYMSGCGGDVTAARYNDGNDDSRRELAGRMHDAMREAWKSTRREPLRQANLRIVPLRLKAETEGALSPEALEKTLANPDASHQERSTAALGLSWQKRCTAGQAIDLPVIDFGPAQFVLLPAESFVEFQLAAQKMRPDSFVVVAAYGECAPGYIPTEQARREGFVQEHGYTWCAAGAEQTILTALKKALGNEAK